MPYLLPFPRFFHPAPGITEALPVTRHGIRNLSPFPFTGTDGPVFASLTIRNGDTGRTARGLCGLLPARCFTNGSVLPHERTLTSRLERQQRLVASDRGALGKPVLLTVPTLPQAAPADEPDAEQVIFYGDNHLYRLRSSPGHGTDPLDLPGPLVIADGHHRAETHALLAAGGNAECAFIPVVVVGADELTIGTFLRLIDPGDRPFADLLASLADHFTVRPLPRALPPTGPHHWLLSYRDQYFALHRPETRSMDTDSGWINQHILPAVFGITDTRTDSRITSVDPPPLADSEVFFDPTDDDKIKLLGFPLARDRFFSEVAEGRTLPPKSTRFEPRVPSGLLVWIP
ncbi:DUF1015 family protein [Lewinella sp. IMCC34183]|uniref:DUF1015 family protein n=1 Tax=Lewinella sp. IMCC34183 TaxID=2248762 RepID=UPI000E234D01|nr:DUF1015 family protein [Lewinella sp. IMCC34183]